MPIRYYILLDNPQTYPSGKEEDLTKAFDFIEIMFLPPNIPPWLQQFDQLSKMWPDSFTEGAFKGFMSVFSISKAADFFSGMARGTGTYTLYCEYTVVISKNLTDENRYEITNEELQNIQEEPNRTLTVEISSCEDE
ncbi:hypothetical protein RF11_15650 [Thelohanellus kitauei]|uniref:DDE-1 domain-containing protein n=1 Tax=Thelohanellus kitauei TaxID=669202 RepID=A0A0C2IZ72_THEKT|nr:hypothetical protein RF11_15650 [Thelohanellus kitauei]